MGVKIYLVVESLTFLIFIWGLLIGIKLSRMKTCPPSIIYFYVYPIVGVIIGIVVYFTRFHLVSKEIGFTTNTLSLFFHFYFLSNFLYKETGKILFIKYFILSLLFLLAFFIVSDIRSKSAYSFAFANGWLFIFFA